MALIRWDPFSELNSLHEQVNTLFNDTFGGSSRVATGTPATDVYSTDKELVIETHLPQFKEEEIAINQTENDLEIKAVHTEKDENDKDRNYLMRESTSSYYRRFTLPRNTHSEKIDAHFENGVLKVTIPYKKLPEPKKIAIKAKNK